MAVCALEVDALDLLVEWDVPGSAALVGHEGKRVGGRDKADELAVGGDGREAVVDGEGGALEGGEGGRERGVLEVRKEDVGF